MTESIKIPARFNGPPTSGNGGASAGILGGLIDGPALVSLRSPPPLDTPLPVRRAHDRLEAWHDDTLVMYARAQAPVLNAPAPPSLEDARRGRRPIPEADHPLPTCFVCGPSRMAGDGLRIFAGPVDGAPIASDVWTPTADLGDDDGLLRPEIMWAALDCPSYNAIPGEPGLALLGSMCAEITSRPKTGEPLIVIGWFDHSDGRKHHTGSALYAADGTLLAQADTLWIQLKSLPSA